MARGVKAIGLIYHLTGRVPMLIKQSHLEEREGRLARPFNTRTSSNIVISLGRLLVSYLPVFEKPMY